MLREFFKEDTKESSMRLVMLGVGTFVCLTIISMCFVIVFDTFKSLEPDWNGMSVFLGSLTLLLGAALTGKVQQKKTELKL